MILKLRKKLTLAYTVTIGIVLACVLSVILYTTEKSVTGRNIENFRKNVADLSQQLQYGSSISQAWLAVQETENALIIHIEENAVPLLFPGSYDASTDRGRLIEQAKEKARSQQVNVDMPPVSTSLQETGILSITGSHKDTYLAYVMTVPSRNEGFKSLVVLHDNRQTNAQITNGRILFLIAGLFGIAAIFLVSWLFVGHSLKPLARNRERQNEFIAAASHELRSPLAVIQASSSAILADSSKTEVFLAAIQKECQRMARLVNDMLVLASADTKGWQIAREQIDMDTLLLDVYEHFEPLCASRHAILKLTLPDAPLPPVLGDRERLEQILAILIDNAIAYALPDGCRCDSPSIELSAWESRHHLCISVADHGPGIPEADRIRVFDRFYRSDHSRRDKSHFGLGLSVAKELAHLHGGSLTLADTPGGGCTFLLKL